MSTKFKIWSATDMWQLETSFPAIPTLSQTLDGILGTDGVPLGVVTELLGLPGSGKTQLSLQLCASVQIPKSLGGLDGEALYIDTNTNFTYHRLKEILEANLLKCRNIIGESYKIDLRAALKRIHYINAFGLEKFCAFMHKLPQFVELHPHLRLIVIDSIVFPFKEGISPRQRTGLLFRLMASLHQVAFDKQIAVVLASEMSTRTGLSSAGGEVVGALGDAWAHRCGLRLLLSAPDYRGEERHAIVMKSNLVGNGVARFRITREEIRDLE